MNKQQITAFAKVLGLKGVDTTTRKGWVLAKCPFAPWRHKSGKDNDPSFGIKIGKTFGNCFACDMHGDLDTLLYRLAVYAKDSDAGQLMIKEARYYLETDGKTQLTIGKQDDDEDEEDKDIVEEWPEWYIDGYPQTTLHPYFENRKGGRIPPAVTKRMGFRYDFNRKRLGVPIRDFEGALMGFHGRSINGGSPPYLAYTHDGKYNRPIWSGENRIDLSRPVVFVESIFDEARVMQVYDNVCSPLSASVNQAKIARMSGALRIVELFDDDKAGRLAASKVRAQLTDSVIHRAFLPDGFGDPGETPAAIMYDVLKPLVDVYDPLL